MKDSSITYKILIKSGVILFFVVSLWSSSCNEKMPNESLNASRKLPKDIDYNFHVKPILSDKCFTCHGPDASKREAELRLDTEEGAYKLLGENQDRSAIVPGRIHRSHGYLRVISQDPEYTMPPPEANLQLSEREKAIVKKWIKQGAKYKPHWSFITLQEQKVPKVGNKAKTNSPIDHFVLAKLRQENLSFNKRASKETLIRRVSFDLTGLPPSLEDIDNFINDDSEDAYENLIDRLLSSKSYGERMAADWMDVARYADSDGYLDDKHRDFSPWRDWVIKAFNENLPYDKFSTWQLAGDLLPNATQETILATAFNRLNKRNSEAGIVYEEYRVEYTADRTHTMGKAFLGLSIECARCHDHKYDPISQKDYYKLFGFFNSTFEIGTPVYGPDQTPGPALLLSDEKEQELIQFLQDSIQEKESEMERLKLTETENLKINLNTTINSQSILTKLNKDLVAYYPFDRYEHNEGRSQSTNVKDKLKPAILSQPKIQKGVKGQAFFITDYNSVKLGDKIGWFERTDPFSIQLWIYPDTLYEEAAVLWHSEDKRLGQKGYSLTLKDNKLEFNIAHSSPQNAIQITTINPIPKKAWSQITLTYDGSSKAKGMRVFVNGVEQLVRKDYDSLYKGILFEWNIHTYGFGGLQFGARTKFVPMKNGGIDEVKVFSRDLTALEILYTFSHDKALSLLNHGNEENSEILNEYHFAHNDLSIREIKSQLCDIREKENKLLNGIKEIMVMGDLPKARPTYVLDRGLYNAPKEIVEPGTPESIMPYDENLPKNRLGLAEWLFDKRNPLAARVYVNRIWQMHFGRGLVKTAEDFGSQGSLPSHPELLDWLANYFIKSGWDIKALHKVILSSATYTQSSKITEDLLEKDPENILLARGPRFRLPAEMIRDNALAISGLLVNRIGGESVYPYQPEGIWDALTNKGWAYKYLQEPGDGLYRRSLYTIWKRTAPPPSMLIFDIADRGVCTVQRKRSNTPLQALVLLNDPQFIEAARVLAEKIIQDKNEPSERLQVAFRMITGRIPDKDELDLLLEFYESELIKFKSKEEDALDFLSIGESTWEKELNPSEIAGLAIVINSTMNTNEGFTRK